MKQNYKKPKMIPLPVKKDAITMQLEMVQIPKGSFMMGSDNGSDDEKPVHTVNIPYNFELGKTVVTIKQYMYFVHDTHSHYPEWLEEGSKYNIEHGSDNHYKGMDYSDNAPIMGISWDDATAYCAWLSDKSGKTYRLPTEAEWEYACRAGTTTEYSFGDDNKELGKYAWYHENSDKKTHPVAQKEPNPWGLYDMHGNVWEWCEDSYTDSYEHTPRDGSAYKNKEKSSKVVRGGSWDDNDYGLRSSFRDFWNDHSYRDYDIGFRLLRTLP